MRLTAPGTNAKSNVSVAGSVFDDKTGEPVIGGEGTRLGGEYSEIIRVGTDGIVTFDVQRAEGVLLEVGGCVHDSQSSDDAGQDGSMPITAGSLRAEVHWTDIFVVVLVSVAGVLML